MSVQTPYNFVPLSRFVLLPDWAEQVSHDHPFRDGWCGELRFTLTARSPLCVGGRQEAASDKQVGRIHFFRAPDGRAAIPGSSLKGMLRQVMEIASFARFRQVEDRRLGVRDISKSKNFYTKAITQQPVKSGWLSYREGQWYLQPCQFVRIYQGDLLRYFGIREGDWTHLKSAQARYQALGGLRPLSFDVEPLKNTPGQAVKLGEGEYRGVLVVTGQPGADFKQKGAKKREFVFYSPRDEAIALDARVTADFMFIHGESKEWAYWKARLGTIQPGVPVFYHWDNLSGSVKSMGLAMMYKLAYRKTLHDAIRNTQAAHLDARHADLPELIFGRLDETDPSGAGNLRGRVNIGLAQVQGTPTFTWTRDTVLSNPKPTFYPAYMRQSPSGDYKTLMDDGAELAGWKRYPAKPFGPGSVQPPPDKARDNKKVQVCLETVPEGSRFSGRLTFHNLRPMELGALLWCLDFGQRERLVHGLGTGKPYGLGQVSLTMNEALLRPNDPATELQATDLVLEACRIAFDDLMQTSWNEATGQRGGRWDKSDALQQLLAMTNPEEGRNRRLRYMTDPKDFMKAKQDHERLDSYVAAVDPAPEPTRHFTPRPAPAPQRHWHEWRDEAVQRRDEAEERHRAGQARQAREAEKLAMSDEQRLVAEIEDRLKQAREGITATLESNLTKLLNQAHGEAGDWAPELRRALLALAEQAQGLGKKKLEKAARKIVRDFGG